MALALYDRIQQTGTASTTISFTLSGSVTGYQSFAVIGNGNTTYYAATDTAGNWEVGIGTYSTTGPTLTRTTILSSSNSGSAVTFSGTVTVFVTYPSNKSVNLDGSGNVSALGTVASGTWQGTAVGLSYGGTGQTTAAAAFNALNPMTTTGDIIYEASANTAARLPVGSNGQVLTVAGGIPSWTAAPGSSTLNITDFTATASQTSFAVTYTVGLVEGVYRNGVKLGLADYTATSGTAIVLASGANSGDLVQVVYFSAVAVSNVVNTFSAGTTGFTPSTASTGAVTLAGTLATTNGGTGLTAVGTNGQVLTSNGSTLSWTTINSGATVSNDTSTASNLYPLFAAATSGTPTTIYTSNAKYLYKPSTGDLSASQVIASNGLIVNNATVSSSYTVATGNNAMSVGPITVASGQSVTVSSGQRWVIL
jgi:hypothetical protein